MKEDESVCVCTDDAYAAPRRFNKTENQFDSKLEYDDYLEQKEDISACGSMCIASCQTWCRLNDWDVFVINNHDFGFAVFNLVEGVEGEATEKRVKEYEKENAEGIAENEARKVGFFCVFYYPAFFLCIHTHKCT